MNVARQGDHTPSRGRFAIVGDLQRTSRLEFWRERNEAETERILHEVLALRPEFVVLLGDLVFRGTSERDWRRLDALIAPLQNAGIDVFPILGNHEYWLTPVAALKRYFRRFDHLGERRWYSKTYEGIGLVFLDSNRSHLRSAAWEEQKAWYEAELARFDVDDSIRGSLVFVHHPPYTNSSVTGDSACVQSAFVPAFQRATKTLAMISGHVHSYERFVRGGKVYLVAGGGGGPRVRLAAGRRLRHRDDRFEGASMRPLHFLTARIVPLGIEIQALGLDKENSRLLPMERFLLAASPSRSATPP